MIKDGVRRYKEIKMEVINRDLPVYEKIKTMIKEESEFLWDNQELARLIITSDIVTQATLFEWLLETRRAFAGRLQQELEKGIQDGEVKPGDALLYTQMIRGVEHQVVAYNILVEGKKPGEEVIEKALKILTEGIFMEK